MTEENDKPPHECPDCGQPHSTPQMDDAQKVMMDAFCHTIVEKGLDPVEQLLLASRVSAMMADMIFQGLAPDVKKENRHHDAKSEYLVRYVSMVDEDLAMLLELPINLSAEDDEEVRTDMDLMPGMSRIH